MHITCIYNISVIKNNISQLLEQDTEDVEDIIATLLSQIAQEVDLVYEKQGVGQRQEPFIQRLYRCLQRAYWAVRWYLGFLFPV